MMLNRLPSRVARRWRRWTRSQPVFALLVTAASGGQIAALILTGGLLFLDIGGIATLIASSDTGPLAVFCLVVVMTITFVSAAMGTAIMGMSADRPGSDDDGGDDGDHRIRVRVPVPVDRSTAGRLRNHRIRH
jgi:membrane protein implicated in regulation of membrane protease activity